MTTSVSWLPRSAQSRSPMKRCSRRSWRTTRRRIRRLSIPIWTARSICTVFRIFLRRCSFTTTRRTWPKNRRRALKASEKQQRLQTPRRSPLPATTASTCRSRCWRPASATTTPPSRSMKVRMRRPAVPRVNPTARATIPLRSIAGCRPLRRIRTASSGRPPMVGKPTSTRITWAFWA